MYVQVVTYGLAGIGEGEYLDVANDVAARFSAMPGLLAKLWLANTEQVRYGAVYLWEDREAMERFLRSDLFEAFNPEFDDVAVEDFDVLENLTVATQPVLQVLEPRRQPPARAPRPPLAKKAGAATAASGARSGARRVPVTSKAATKATKKVAKKTVTTAKKAPVTAKGATRATKAGAAKKAATTAVKKTTKKAR